MQPPDAIPAPHEDAAVLVTTPVRLSSSAASLQFIRDLVRYGDAIAAMNQHPLCDLPVNISRPYLQGYNAQFETQWSIVAPTTWLGRRFWEGR